MARRRRALTAVMFTDVVGSTRLRIALGETAAEELRSSHEGLLKEAVHTHGGIVVKGLGDGVMATFDGASNAMAAAVAIQQGVDLRNRRRPEPVNVAVRIGLSVGEVVWDGDDCFGIPVIEASRLCAMAEGGQVLATDTVRLLGGVAGGSGFTSLGEHTLKGLAQPVGVAELTWAPAEETGSLVPLPAALVPEEGPPFVGRSEERARLDSAWRSVADGQRGVVMVSGEAGVGKTRLVSEAARAVHDAGATVLFGQCDEQLSGSYQPFVESLDRYVRLCPIDELRAQLGPTAAELVGLLPSLAGRVPGLERPTRADPEMERYMVFEAVIELLARISEVRPVLLLLDDLHWMGDSSALLLKHLLRSPEEMRLLVVGTYRHTDLDRSHPFARLLWDLPRLRGPADRIHLDGLEESDLAAAAHLITGEEPDEETRALAAALHASTGGNAFFAAEVVRDLQETGAVVLRDGQWRLTRPLSQLRTPDSVRAVVSQRLARLPETVHQVLSAAAVIGGQFTLPMLTEVTGHTFDRVVDAVDNAEQADLVVAQGERYVFAHFLVRRSLYEGLASARRLWLHRAVGLALEAGHAGDEHVRLGQLAHHLGQAAALGNPDDLARALHAALRAGFAAKRVHAMGEAHANLERALDLWNRVAPAHRARWDHVQLLSDTADAARWAGDIDRATDLVRQALEEVDPATDPAVAGALHEQLGRYLWNAGDSPGAQTANEEAMRLLTDQPESALRARVLAQTAMGLMLAGQYRSARVHCEQAVAMARAVGARAEEGRALNVLGVTLAMTGDPGAGLEALRESLAIARDVGSLDEIYVGYVHLSYTLTETGRLEEALAVAEEGLELLRRLDLAGSRGQVLVANAADVLRRLGRWEQAERLAPDALGDDVPPLGASLMHFILADLGTVQGEFSKAERHIRVARDLCPHMTDPQWMAQFHLSRAKLASWRGEHARARGEIADGLAAVEGSEEYELAVRLGSLGLRIEADRAGTARAVGDEAAIAEAVASGQRLLERTYELRDRLERAGTLFPDVRARVALCAAEHSRLRGASDPRLWASVVEQWTVIPCPHPAAYARWRLAEALLASGEHEAGRAELALARSAAQELGARPLNDAIEALERRVGGGLATRGEAAP